jgi:hypothetical protein
MFAGIDCCHSGQNLLSSRLLPKNIKIIIYKTIILRVVLYGCKSWPLKLREEHILMAFENRMLRRMFELNRAEVTGGWRKLHNEEQTKIIKLSFKDNFKYFYNYFTISRFSHWGSSFLYKSTLDDGQLGSETCSVETVRI